MLSFNDYQNQALATDSYANSGKNIDVTDLAFLNKVLGLVGESGEVAEKIKKILRNQDGKMTEDDKKEIVKELGDVLWYMAVLSSYLGYDFETVAKNNLTKLADRADRGVIKSKGDNR